MDQLFTCTECNSALPNSDFYSAKKRGTLTRYQTCKSCFRERMNKRNNQAKETLVQEHGGSCQHCGYSRSCRVLQFHHLDPKQKEFGLAERASGNLERLRKEAAKCILLCPTCHAEKHEGLW